MLSNPELFRCPHCRGPLSLPDETTDTCQCRGCQCQFDVVDDIPLFASPDNCAISFGYQWNIHSQTQLDSYSGLPNHPQTLETVRGWFESKGFIDIEVRYGPNGVVGTGQWKLEDA